METIVLVVGLLLAGYCLLVAIKPEWFTTFSVVRRDSAGNLRGASRLGNLPIGAVRVVYLVFSIALVVATLVIHDFARQQRICDDARTVFDAGRAGWAQQAASHGYSLRTAQIGSLTKYELIKNGTVVATWGDAGWGVQLTCPPESSGG